ncbi:hypothetical protein KIW84_042000 [Lathyrus oleraceus]|uniref:Uncharacterized protein n=1 Tax=Pisum sativum TaxID=3888 RepID=A0A9D4XEG7_PEA|nr:hypothetical protein KIW84_042000 [Pisum sativum]
MKKSKKMKLYCNHGGVKIHTNHKCNMFVLKFRLNVALKYFRTIRSNDDAYDFAAYTCATEVDGKIFVEYDVTGIEVIVNSPRCVNEIIDLDGCDDEGVERFNDSENERTTAIVDGFDGIDVSLPINEGTIFVGLLIGSKKKKWEDDEYVSDELDNSDQMFMMMIMGLSLKSLGKTNRI